MPSKNGKEDTINLEEYKITAFISAVARARSFLLATIIVSTLIFARSYIAWSPCEAQQLAGTIARTPGGNLEAGLLSAQKQFGHTAMLYQKPGTGFWKDPEVMGSLITQAQGILELNKAINMLKQVKPESRPLWVLPFNVPDGNFVPLMGIMLTMLTACLWLSARAMVDAVHGCDEEHLKEVARLNLLFPSSWKRSREEYSGQERSRWGWFNVRAQDISAKIMEIGTLVAPPVALALAGATEATSLRTGTAGPPTLSGLLAFVGHPGLLMGLTWILVLLAFAGGQKAREMDRTLRKGKNRHGAPRPLTDTGSLDRTGELAANGSAGASAVTVSPHTAGPR